VRNMPTPALFRPMGDGGRRPGEGSPRRNLVCRTSEPELSRRFNNRCGNTVEP
jgi:hypothetical protein